MNLAQVRFLRQPFRSKLFELPKGDSEMLEQLATEMYARGLTTRDIKAAFTNEHGVCEVIEALWEEYEAFQQRGLRDIPVLYVFLDGLYEPLRMHGIQKEALVCAWASTTEGDSILPTPLPNLFGCVRRQAASSSSTLPWIRAAGTWQRTGITATERPN